MLKINVVTGFVARDGGEIMVACYFGYLYYSLTAIKRALIALAVALPLAVLGHFLINEIDVRWRPFELTVALGVPIVIMIYCFTHLPTQREERKRQESQQRWGPSAVAAVVALETFEITVSTLEQDAAEIRDGLVTGLLILLGVVALYHLITRALASWRHSQDRPSFGEMIHNHMTKAMAWLNVAIAAFGLVILYNVHEPLEEYHRKALVVPIMAVYGVVLAVLVVTTITLVRSRSNRKRLDV